MKFEMLSKPFFRYLRDRENNPVGLAVVFSSNKGGIKAGWSKLHPADRFDRASAKNIALQRAMLVDTSEYREMMGFAPHGMERFVSQTIEMALQWADRANSSKANPKETRPRGKVARKRPRRPINPGSKGS